MPPTDSPVHRVVVIGCGFGGLFATKRLDDPRLDVTVVDRTANHVFQPLLYQVATGILSEGDIAPPIRGVLRHQRNARTVMAEVTDVDLDRRVVCAKAMDCPLELPYDSLIVAAGARTSYFGHDEFAADAPGLKTVEDALEVRRRLLSAFEMAEAEPDAARRQAWLTFAVVGGGPAGVELAGQIAELSRVSLAGDFRTIDPTEARVLLLDGAPRILSAFDERLAQRAEAELTRLGIEVHSDTMVLDVDAQGLELKTGDGGRRRLETRTTIWAAGVQASALGRQLAERSGAQLTKSGQIEVRPDCTLPGHPEVFVVGDLMALDDLPGLAEVAMQSGMHAALQIRRRLDGDTTPRRLRYVDLGSLAVISRSYAIGQRGGVRLWGKPGWLVWLVVHLTFLTGFKNRIGALVSWTLTFFGRSRSQRTVSPAGASSEHGDSRAG